MRNCFNYFLQILIDQIFLERNEQVIPQEGDVGGAIPQEGDVGGAIPQEGDVGGAIPREGDVGGAIPQEGAVGGAIPRVGGATPKITGTRKQLDVKALNHWQESY